MQLYRMLLEHLGSDFEFRINLWKLDILANSELRQIAANDATAASMIIICLDHQSELNSPARQWIDSWAQHKASHRALLALLVGDKSAALSPAEVYLKNAAAEANMDFLLQRFEPMPAAESLGKSKPRLNSAPTSGD